MEDAWFVFDSFLVFAMVLEVWAMTVVHAHGTFTSTQHASAKEFNVVSVTLQAILMTTGPRELSVSSRSWRGIGPTRRIKCTGCTG
eukprot:5341053-Amphidinium_carterae.2